MLWSVLLGVFAGSQDFCDVLLFSLLALLGVLGGNQLGAADCLVCDLCVLGVDFGSHCALRLFVPADALLLMLLTPPRRRSSGPPTSPSHSFGHGRRCSGTMA